jgi:hypothetical protein
MRVKVDLENAGELQVERRRVVESSAMVRGYLNRRNAWATMICGPLTAITTVVTAMFGGRWRDMRPPVKFNLI